MSCDAYQGEEEIAEIQQGLVSPVTVSFRDGVAPTSSYAERRRGGRLGAGVLGAGLVGELPALAHRESQPAAQRVRAAEVGMVREGQEGNFSMAPGL
jgi:hypothetical protein